jgi:hypothetical protein
VGPNIKLDDAYELGVEYEAESKAGLNEREAMTSLRVEYRTGLYHDEAMLADDETSDVAFAFNAGIWGYDPNDWMPTIARVVMREETPLVVTSYSLLEAESDEDSMRAGLKCSDKFCWRWEAELNPSSSVKIRELGFDRKNYMDEKNDREELIENSAWQCLVAA